MFLLEVVAALTKARVRYAVAGGYAVSLHGAVRGTLDIDFVISLTPKQLENAEAALESLGLSSRIPATHSEISKFRLEYIKKRNLIAWSFVDTKDPTRQVDLILTDDVSKHELVTKRILDTPVKVLSIPSLIKMKKAADRPQDREDIKALEKLL